MLRPVLDTDPTLAAIAGLVHGFTDRDGGVSTGRYATLNMASKWGDDTDAVLENRRRVAAHAGFALDRLRTVKQVHGGTVVRATELRDDTTADALWCHRDDHVVVGVLTADCVPILLADREGTVAAAIHSGWRSTVANIAARTVQALVQGGVPASRLVAAIGPCIELDAFEVGPEVAASFDARFVREQQPRPHVDLVGVVRTQLEDAGVDARAIAKVGGCTHAHPDRWYSFRRDGAGIGQMLAFVGFR
jgi:hypothetical protein